MRVINRPEVYEDLISAAGWYDQRRDGLGVEFENEFLDALTIIESRPESFAPDHTGYRACRLKRFAAVVYFVVTGDSIIVAGVFVNGRNESRLRDRK